MILASSYVLQGEYLARLHIALARPLFCDLDGFHIRILILIPLGQEPLFPLPRVLVPFVLAFLFLMHQVSFRAELLGLWQGSLALRLPVR